MIKLQIIGNLGGDCQQKEINGKTVINFNVAHTERFKDAQGNQKERTTWVNCAYWTDRTAIAQYLKKGQLIYAEGSPEADGYLNKENQASATLRMRVRDIQLLGGRSEASSEQNQAASSEQGQAASSMSSSSTNVSHPTTSAVEDADDLPF